MVGVQWVSGVQLRGGGGDSESRSNLQLRWVKLSVSHWRTAAHPLLCISVTHPQASSCPMFCDRKGPMVLEATDEPILFLRFCAVCRLCTRDIAQSSFGGGGSKWSKKGGRECPGSLCWLLTPDSKFLGPLSTRCFGISLLPPKQLGLGPLIQGLITWAHIGLTDNVEMRLCLSSAFVCRSSVRQE